MSILTFWVVLVGFSGSTRAEVFACGVEGLDAAIAASELGDSGPHALDCAAGQLVEMQDTRTLQSDLTLDFRGGVVECPRQLGSSVCNAYFRLIPPITCSHEPACPDKAIFGPTPTIVFENLVARPAPNSQLLARIFFSSLGASLTLRNVSLSAPNTYAVYVSLPARPPTAEELASEIRILDSDILGPVGSGPGAMRIERSRLSDPAGLLLFSGAVYVFPTATVDVLESTVDGIFNGGGLVRVRNSTVYPPPPKPYRVPTFAYGGLRSAVCSTGGAAFLIPSGDLIISNSIFNGCTTSVEDYDPEVTRMHLPDACKYLVDLYPPPTIISEGGNVVVGGGACGTTDPTDRLNVSPEALALGPLEDNGGPTATHALLETSVARDAGVDCQSSATDQRGVARPDGDPAGDGVCDSGAVEFVDCDGSGVDDGTEIAQGLLTDTDGDLVPDVCQPVPVVIDIRPKDDRNRIPANLRGLLPVALFGSEVFDVADVDVSSLAFGPSGTAPVRLPRLRYKDVNRDGYIDLVAVFRLSKSGLDAESTEACLSGALVDGSPFQDCDSITVPKPLHHAKKRAHAKSCR